MTVQSLIIVSACESLKNAMERVPKVFLYHSADGKVPFDGWIIQYFRSHPVKPVRRNQKMSEELKNTNKTNSKKVKGKSCLFCSESFTRVAEHKPVS